jgi:hypothetical protein
MTPPNSNDSTKIRFSYLERVKGDIQNETGAYSRRWDD